MRNKSLGLVGVCAAWLCAPTVLAAGESSLARLRFLQSLQAGVHDTNGALVAGTEVMSLVPHQGRLYAGTSLWKESDPAVPKACQVLALDSPKGPWRVDHTFTRNNLRLSSLKSVTFLADAQGRACAPVSVLLAAPDVMRGSVSVYSRNDATGEWVASALGTVTNYTTVRALGFFRNRVFAGTDTLGVIGGLYDPDAPGHIRWDTAPEFQTPAGERVMGFCVCDGVFYCATSRHIFRRADKGSPLWAEVYACLQEKSPCGIRGLSAVPKPGGEGSVLLFAALSKVRRLDPACGYKETVELDLPEFLTRQLGAKVTFALSAYNDFVPCAESETGETVWLFGFESAYAARAANALKAQKARLFFGKNARLAFAAEGRYCVRRVKGAEVRYEMGMVSHPDQPALVAVRAIAVSPFPEDRARAFYFGGFDCNDVPSHDTAWIYRGERCLP